MKSNGIVTEKEMEMECIFTTKEVDNGMEMERKWNGNGMEKNYYPNLEVKLNGVKWKWNGETIATSDRKN